MTVRPVAPVLLTVLGVLLGGCTADPGASEPDPAGSAAPPAPPAACLLDTPGLAAATGLTWVPDTTTANDTRCVYDPGPGLGAGQAGGIDFVAVDVVPSAGPDPATELDVLAEACADGSRAPLDGGFVCRFPGGSVFAVAARGARLVTITASAVPVGTTAAALVVGFTAQLAGPLR